MNIIQFSAPEISGIAKLIYNLINACSSVAIGVILFTLILKLITFPFDYASRASMRKNSLKMEKMRPELEKLQRQYADNKELYNQKMMALYKKNGYSMFGACLPTILTLVIFIVAINAFTDYSKFQNQEYFYNMSKSYNNVVYAGFELPENNTDYIYRNENGEFIVNVKNVKEAENKVQNGDQYSFEVGGVTINYTEANGNFYLWTNNGYSKYVTTLSNGATSYELMDDKLLDSNVIKNAENNNLTVMIDGQPKTFIDSGMTASAFIEDIRQTKSAETYYAEKQTFFWVKNIWATDSPLSHPIEESYDNFKKAHGYEGYDLGTDGSYNKLIGKLEAETTAPNGYFILIALTALSSLLMQLVMGKANQAQMELQTVDGQGAQTQQMMKWMMPIMMAFFAFMYTAAFSIYIIMSSVISVLTTFLINFIVDKSVAKEEKSQETGKIYGKVHETQEKPQPKKQETKPAKKQAPQTGDGFLSGTADKKHYRGRIK